jgi:GNAT superfamily N-acetyltransferase
MSPAIRPAEPLDLERLLPLVRTFWSFEKLPFESVNVGGVLGTLLANPSLGRVFVAESAETLVGYLVLTFGYSLEHGGRDALVDELFVQPDLRSSGLGTRLVESAVQTCREHGMVRLHLEVDRTNPRAEKLYGRLGFAANDRFLLTKKV